MVHLSHSKDGFNADSSDEVSAGNLTYTYDTTPFITNINPRVGSHAGGTEVILTGRHIHNTYEVKIDGLQCVAITLPEEISDCTNADCEIKCTTSAKDTEALNNS